MAIRHKSYDEINKIVEYLAELIKNANSIAAIKSNPTAYNSRPTQGWHCSNYSPSPDSIPESYRVPKYLDLGNHPTYTVGRQLSEASHMEDLKDITKQLLAIVEEGLSDLASYPTDTPVEQLPTINPKTIAKLEHIDAIISTCSSIALALSQADDWYSNDLCNRSCQLVCQVGCQIACQSVEWCHNQSCGGF